MAWSGGEIGTKGVGITSPEGEVIPTGESQEFTFRARTPESPCGYAWPASQTYKDGSVVEWAGPADSEDPAPVVEVATSGPESTASEATGHEPGEGTGAHDHGDGDHERGTDGEGILAATTRSCQAPDTGPCGRHPSNGRPSGLRHGGSGKSLMFEYPT